jgi:hypothetical protein
MVGVEAALEIRVTDCLCTITRPDVPALVGGRSARPAGAMGQEVRTQAISLRRRLGKRMLQ